MNVKRKILSILLCALMVLPSYTSAQTVGHVHEEGEEAHETQTIAATKAPTPTRSPIAASEEAIEQMPCEFAPDGGNHKLGSENGIFQYPGGNLMRGAVDRREYEASCTRASGSSVVRPCQYCLTWFTVTVEDGSEDAKGHKFGAEDSVVSRCDGVTYKTKTCTECGYIEVTTENGKPDLSAHDIVEETITKGDCKTDNSVKKVCKDCGAVVECTDNGPKGHSGVLRTIQNGNCQQNFIRQFDCGVCGYSYKKEYPGDHIYVLKDNPKATCESEGTRSWECITCGKEDPSRPTETVPALGHSWKDVDASACTDGHEQVCTRCGTTRVVDGDGTIDHIWGELKIQPATCTEAGYEYHTCQRCGITEKTRENVSPMIDHTFTLEEWITQPTCGEPGLKARKCAVCGTRDENYISVDATGKHTPMVDDGDCTTEVRCSVCGQITTEAKTEHEWKYTQIVSPQHTTKWHKKACKNCNVVLEELCSGKDDGDCMTGINCELCGSEITSGSFHVKGTVYVPYEEDMDNYHVTLCGHKNCEKTADWTKEEHTYVDGQCTKCGHVDGKTHIPNGVYESDGEHHWQRCKLCGAKTDIQAHDKSATSHYEGDCTKAVKCSVCERVVREGTSHNYTGDWLISGEYHYRVCSNPGCECVEKYDHIPLADRDCTTATKCKDCGFVLVEGAAEHSWVAADSGHTESGHKLVCSNPDCDQTKLEEHSVGIAANCHEKAECAICHTKFGNINPDNHVGNEEIRDAKEATEWEEGYTGDIYCLGCGKIKQRGETIEKSEPHKHEYTLFEYDGSTHVPKCSICGALNEEARSSHIYGGYESDESSHSRKCTICGNVESKPHEHSEAVYDCTVDIVCVDCGRVLVKGKESHNFNGRVEGLPEGHTTACTNENCRVVSDLTPHIGGSSSCQSGAHCEVCNFEYKEKDLTNHVGGTELRNKKDATTTEEGYTGDTYCLGCENIIEAGSSIPKLHEHSFGDWMSDETHHWKECTCGEREGYAAHSYEKGECTVCGAKDPTYTELPDVLVDSDTLVEAVIPEDKTESYKDIELLVDILTSSDKDFSAVLATVGKKYTSFVPFDIRLVNTATGENAQPNGTLTIRIPLPEDWDASKTLVYYVNGSAMTAVTTALSEDGKYITFTVDHLSLYVLADAESEKTESSKTGDGFVLWFSIAGLSAMAVATLTVSKKYRGKRAKLSK